MLTVAMRFLPSCQGGPGTRVLLVGRHAGQRPTGGTASLAGTSSPSRAAHARTHLDIVLCVGQHGVLQREGSRPTRQGEFLLVIQSESAPPARCDCCCGGRLRHPFPANPPQRALTSSAPPSWPTSHLQRGTAARDGPSAQHACKRTRLLQTCHLQHQSPTRPLGGPRSHELELAVGQGLGAVFVVRDCCGAVNELSEGSGGGAIWQGMKMGATPAATRHTWRGCKAPCNSTRATAKPFRT